MQAVIRSFETCGIILQSRDQDIQFGQLSFKRFQSLEQRLFIARFVFFFFFIPMKRLFPLISHMDQGDTFGQARGTVSGYDSAYSGFHTFHTVKRLRLCRIEFGDIQSQRIRQFAAQ